MRNAVLVLAFACALIAFSSGPQATLDIAIRDTGGHALLRLGFASIRVAFDSGHSCPNSNACSGAIL